MELRRLTDSARDEGLEKPAKVKELGTVSFSHWTSEEYSNVDFFSPGERYEWKFRVNGGDARTEKEISNVALEKFQSPQAKVPSNSPLSYSGSKKQNGSSRKKIRRSLDSSGWKINAQDVSMSENNADITPLKINLSKKFQSGANESELIESGTPLIEKPECLPLNIQESNRIKPNLSRESLAHKPGVEYPSEPNEIAESSRLDTHLKSFNHEWEPSDGKEEGVIAQEAKANEFQDIREQDESESSVIGMNRLNAFQVSTGSSRGQVPCNQSNSNKFTKKMSCELMDSVNEAALTSFIPTNGVNDSECSRVACINEDHSSEIFWENTVKHNVTQDETDEERKTRWRQDSVFRGMEYVGCEHQYSEVNYKKFLERKKWFQV